jgi:hypothetical protein
MINGYLGGEAVPGDYYESSTNLFVFTLGRKPVRLTMGSSDFLTRDRPDITYGPDVGLIVDRPGEGLGRLEE